MKRLLLPALLASHPLCGLVNVQPPSWSDIQRNLPQFWSDVSTHAVNPNWKYSERIGWFWLPPDWNLVYEEGIDEPILEFWRDRTWIYQTRHNEWQYWIVRSSERRISDGGGYVSYQWPDSNWLWKPTSGWYYTSKKIYPWVYSYTSNAWEFE